MSRQLPHNCCDSRPIGFLSVVQSHLKFVNLKQAMANGPFSANIALFNFSQLEPYMNIGPHFSNTPCVKKFKVTNSGRRLQQLVWSTDGFPLVRPRRDPLYDAKDIKYKVCALLQ